MYVVLGTNCNPLQIPNYMTKIVVCKIIHYITHFGNIIGLRFDYFIDYFGLYITYLSLDLNRIIFSIILI